MLHVDDAEDRRLDDYRQLTDAEARRSIEAAHGIFVVEGRLALERLLASSHPVRSILLSDAKAASFAPALSDVAAPVYVAPRRVLESITGYDVHRGVLACAERPAPRAASELWAAARTVVVLEGVNDNENIGSIFRNGAALGIDAVLLDDRCADPLYRRSIRVSSGWSLEVPWTRVRSAPATVDLLRDAGFTTLAMTPAAGAVDIAEVCDELAPDRAVALVLGAEGPGLEPATIESCDRAVRIPMRPGVDSLNVATSLAVAASFLAARRSRS